LCQAKRRYVTKDICLSTPQHDILKAIIPVIIIDVIRLVISMLKLLQIWLILLLPPLPSMAILMLIIIIHLFIIKELTQQPEDQLQAQQKNIRENT
jgi:hypothetical protein